MALQDKLYIVKKKFFSKRNILLFVVLSLLLTVIFSCITMMNFMILYKKELVNQDLGRTLVTYNIPEDIIEKVKKIEHIEVVASNKFLHAGEAYISLFDEMGIEGYITVKPLLLEKDIHLLSGKTSKAMEI